MWQTNKGLFKRRVPRKSASLPYFGCCRSRVVERGRRRQRVVEVVRRLEEGILCRGRAPDRHGGLRWGPVLGQRAADQDARRDGPVEGVLLVAAANRCCGTRGDGPLQRLVLRLLPGKRRGNGRRLATSAIPHTVGGDGGRGGGVAARNWCLRVESGLRRIRAVKNYFCVKKYFKLKKTLSLE
jgi:hypothetical protein